MGGHRHYIHRWVYEQTFGVTLGHRDRLVTVCDTYLCGNPEHWMIGNPKAQLVKELYYQAQLQDAPVPAAAIARQLGTTERYAQKAIQYMWRKAPDTPSQAAMREQGRLPNDEDTRTFVITGRIIYVPANIVYEDVRQAEVSTGIDRIEIAKSCNTNAFPFCYERSIAQLHETINLYDGTVDIKGNGMSIGRGGR